MLPDSGEDVTSVSPGQVKPADRTTLGTGDAMRRTAVAGELRTGGERRAAGPPPAGAAGAGAPGAGQPGAGQPGAGQQWERQQNPGSRVLWETLRDVVSARAAQAGRPGLDVLDVGGGTGGFAVPLARLGHSVTVIDPSPDSLAAAQRRAAEAGVPLRAVQGDVSDLPAAAGREGADVVLCHSVLEYVDSPEAAMAAIAAILRPGGVVSVLAASAVAAVIHRVLAGRFDEARKVIAAMPAPPGEAGPDGPAGDGDQGAPGPRAAGQDGIPRRFTLPAVVGLIERAGLRPGPGHGVRVFTDLVPSMFTDTDPDAAGALLALEETAAAHPAFRGMATQLHVLGFR
jgi:S-adenosylmethionine-dependent methyltransferase